MRKRLMAFITCLLVLIVLIGCTKKSDISSETSEKNVKDKTGGYVEEIVKVADDIRYIYDITKSENGDLIICALDNAFNNKVFVSSDNGTSWSEREIKHLSLEREVKSKSLNLLRDGNILITYVFTDGVKYAMANANGEVSPIDLDVNQGVSAEGINYAPTSFTALNNGDFMYRSMETGEVVQIDGESLKEKFRCDGGLMFSKGTNLGEKLIIDSLGNTSIYDMNTGQSVKDLESELFNNDQLGIFVNSYNNEYLYNYSTEGLYYYDLEKKENIILINDSKYLKDQDNSMNKLIEMDGDSYIALISSIALPTNMLIKYSYDPNYEKVDNSDVVIYSLIESDDIRRKIAIYQSNNPDIEIKYQVGVSSNDGVEVSDAIKTLNTEIMAGRGPDIILLDGLPADSFVQKGVLADMSDIVAGNEKEFFERVLNSYKVNGIVTQVPLSIKVPVLIGNKEVIKKVNDLDSLLAVIKENAKKSDDRLFSMVGTPEEFMSVLYCIYGNDCMTDKKINKDNLIKFMKLGKEIYDIAKVKEDIFWEKEKEAMGIQNGEEIEFINNFKNDIFPTLNVREVIYPKDKPLLAIGGINNNYAIEDIVNMQISKTDLDYRILNSDNKNIFLPYNNIAINKNNKNLDLSKDIIKNFIEQNASKGTFTIYKTNFIKELSMNKESNYNEANDHYVKYVETDIDENGNKVEYPLYWANEKDISNWVTAIDKLNVAMKVNMTVLNEVAMQFKSVIEENIEVEKAVSNVEKKLEIYLAE